MLDYAQLPAGQMPEPVGDIGPDRQPQRRLIPRAQGGEDLDALLPEAFANCREAAKRALGLRAFDVQLMGGIFLHQGKIEEEGHPDEVFGNPKSQRLQQFLKGSLK